MISLFKENLETLKKSPEYIKNEMLIMMFNVFINSIILVVVSKLQGLFLTGFMIGAITVITKIISLYSQKIKDIYTSTKYKFIVFIDAVYIFLFVSYIFIPTNVWLITYMLSGAVHYVFLTSFFVDYDIILKETLSSYFFKRVMYLERFLTTIAAIIGAAVGSFLMYFFVDNNHMLELGVYQILLITTAITILILVFEFKQYNYFYKDLKTTHTKDECDTENNTHIIMTFEEFKNKYSFKKK